MPSAQCRRTNSGKHAAITDRMAGPVRGTEVGMGSGWGSLGWNMGNGVGSGGGGGVRCCPEAPLRERDRL